MPGKSIRVLINAGGGTVKAVGPDKQCDLIVESFARHGMTAKVEALEGDALADEVRRGQGDVAVGGGDGTIAAAAGVLADSGRTLGVLPLGTLNHFAKDLGVADLDAAVDAIAAGHTRDVDVGEVGGRVFINNSSIGFYPQMVAERTREQEASGMPKWPAMILAALRTFRRFPRHRLSITIEGRKTPCLTPCVFVGNNAYELAGFDVGKRARLDRGELFLVVVRGTTLWRLAAVSLRAAIGKVDEADDIEVIRGIRNIEIASNSAMLAISADGEVTRVAPPLVYRIRPGALRVFAPI